MKHVFLVDGSGFIFRAYHAIRPMTRPDGTPVNAVYGFTTMLMKLIDDTDADHVAVIFDAARKTFRNDIYPDYKANRPPAPDDLIPQFALVREATRAFNVACIEMENYEADDLIATYARQAREKGAQVTIVSSDKDLMQLVGDGVALFDAMKDRMIGPDAVAEKFGVGPDKVIEVQALAGDSSDNVPGVPGIGVKTAAQLIAEYGDLETLLARAEEIKQPKRRQSLIDNAEMARVSKRLVTLRDDVPVPDSIESFAVAQPDAETLLGFLRDNAFRSLIPKVESRLAAAGGAPAPASLPAEKPEAYELVQDEAALKAWVDAAFFERLRRRRHRDRFARFHARQSGRRVARPTGARLLHPAGAQGRAEPGQLRFRRGRNRFRRRAAAGAAEGGDRDSQAAAGG